MFVAQGQLLNVGSAMNLDFDTQGGLTRRGLLLGGTASACQFAAPAIASLAPSEMSFDGQPLHEIYGHVSQNRWDLHEIPVDEVNPLFLRTRILNTINAPLGSLLVDTGSGHLYFFDSPRYGIRYGIAVARDGFLWRGTGIIARRAKWPTWTPPREMIAREPKLAKWKTGMPSMPSNPLGPRALYVYQDGADTLIRVHGTPHWRSIGTKASSGCFRMFNQDVVDLYERVPKGTQITVL